MSSFMRLLVFFDLPVKTKEEKQLTNTFKRHLLNDGFYMIQFSIYGRLCNTLENAEQHENRISAVVPPKGSIRSMIVTEKQYNSMRIWVGKKKSREKGTVEGQLTFF